MIQPKMRDCLSIHPKDERLLLISQEIDCVKHSKDFVADVVRKMRLAMVDSGGVGIAAPQIGESYRIVIVEELIMINPTIKPFGDYRIIRDFEGCLSLPNQIHSIPRFDRIEVTYKTRDNFIKTEKLFGFSARIAQHEVDHLDGILIGVNHVERDTIQ